NVRMGNRYFQNVAARCGEIAAPSCRWFRTSVRRWELFRCCQGKACRLHEVQSEADARCDVAFPAQDRSGDCGRKQYPIVKTADPPIDSVAQIQPFPSTPGALDR